MKRNDTNHQHLKLEMNVNLQHQISTNKINYHNSRRMKVLHRKKNIRPKFENISEQ